MLILGETDSDSWLRLDNTHYNQWEEVKEKFAAYFRHDTEKVGSERYIDRMPRSGHDVFVTHKQYKCFGDFVGTNENGKAFVSISGTQGPISLEAKEVISM